MNLDEIKEPERPRQRQRSVYLDDDLVAVLEEYARKRGIGASTAVRLILRKELLGEG